MIWGQDRSEAEVGKWHRDPGAAYLNKGAPQPCAKIDTAATVSYSPTDIIKVAACQLHPSKDIRSWQN